MSSDILAETPRYRNMERSLLDERLPHLPPWQPMGKRDKLKQAVEHEQRAKEMERC